jgi:hypothetical protein
MEQKRGIISVLDALGAATYNDKEISQFLSSRERVLELLTRKANAKQVRGDMNIEFVTTFTFNDTVLIVYCTPGQPTLNDVLHFCLLLRKFMVDSLVQGILFRGSVSIGNFYVDDQSNTVMGTAVTDAAAWYDSADWVGINATPHATLVVKALLHGGEDLDHVLVDYPVPLKGRPSLDLKAVNWPKAFYVEGLRPVKEGEDPKAKCLELLAEHRVPKGTESKHFNTVAFFDHCIGLYKKQLKTRKRKGT